MLHCFVLLKKVKNFKYFIMYIKIMHIIKKETIFYIYTTRKKLFSMQSIIFYGIKFLFIVTTFLFRVYINI
jgi:hypothetical protein